MDLVWSAHRAELEDTTWPITEFSIETVSWLLIGDEPKRFWPPAPALERKFRKREAKEAADPTHKGRGARADGSGGEASSSDDPSSGAGSETDGSDCGNKDVRVALKEFVAKLEEPPREGDGGGEGEGGGGEVEPDPAPPVVDPEPDPPPVAVGLGEGAVPPPPPPPPLAKGKGRGRGGGGKKYDPLLVRDVNGDVIGHILVNENAKSLDAHCYRHGADCAIGRTFLPYEYKPGEKLTPFRSARGRPLGFLVAWLRWGCRPTVLAGELGRQTHVEAKAGKGDAKELASGLSDIRKRAREWAESDPGMEPARNKERRPRATEPLELFGHF